MRIVIALVVLMLPGWAFGQEADLTVSLVPSYDASGEVVLDITVGNNGPDGVMDLDVVAAFDKTANSVVSLEPGCTESAVGAACSFSSLDAPVLAPDEERVLSMRLQTAGEGEVVVTANSTTEDPNATNDRASISLAEPVHVDVAVDEHGIDAGKRKILVFDATNYGPNTAENVRVTGTVTVDFDGPKSESDVRNLTGMNADEGAVCGRQVPTSAEAVARWTFPVTCSIADLDVGQLIEFEFWFEGGSNALFRLSAVSANFDENLANNVTDGSFLNSPIEYVETEDEGCCATVSAVPSVSPLAAIALMILVGGRRRYCRT